MGKRFNFFDGKGKERVLVIEKPVRYRVVLGIRVLRGEKVDYAVGIEVLNGEPDSRARELRAGVQALCYDDGITLYDARYKFIGKPRIGVPSGRVLEARK
jgi:hypothetical protein